MVDASVSDLSKLVATGTCVTVDGCLKIPPEGKGKKQKIELSAEKVTDVGTVDPATYPIPKSKLSLPHLRDNTHLRARTTTFAAVTRIRDKLSSSTHLFCDEHYIRLIHTPIITTSDCEGAGEMFQVTTMINQSDKLDRDLVMNPPPTEADIEAAKLIVKEKGEAVAQLKAAKVSKLEITASVAELTEAKETLAELEERSRLKPGLPKKDGKIDYSQDFFGRQAFLTVSGQLHLETYACSMGDVYTFSPTFRA